MSNFKKWEEGEGSENDVTGFAKDPRYAFKVKITKTVSDISYTQWFCLLGDLLIKPLITFIDTLWN